MLAVLSLSARRAWIETIDDLEPSSTRKVALRKESVDRNCMSPIDVLAVSASLSARRAWIETFCYCSFGVSGVGRSPQGERG